jgi:hypothetical protein
MKPVRYESAMLQPLRKMYRQYKLGGTALKQKASLSGRFGKVKREGGRELYFALQQTIGLGFRYQTWLGPCHTTMFGLFLLVLVVLTAPARAQGVGTARVEAEVGVGPRFVGQVFELRLIVVASGKAPKIEPPRAHGARLWLMGIESEPVTATAIGATVTRQSRFIIRLRVLAERPGTLEIPSIRIQLEADAVRSRPLRVRIQPVPLDGRPAEFLGGVGRFTVEAQAVPSVVRVGQELDFRIKVGGPAAWGMNHRPDLARFNRLSLPLRIEAHDDQTVDEPPSRTFEYRLRPMKPGEAILPPVVIAAFEPAVSRFVTHATLGVPIRVVAVPSFDTAAIDGAQLEGRSDPWDRVAWIVWGSASILLLACFVALARVRRRSRLRPVLGPQAARRYAAQLARRLQGRKPQGVRWQPPWRRVCAPGPGADDHDVARRVCHELIRYLEIGAYRPPGALTPDEAREGVVQLTRSEKLGLAASELTMDCDRVLYRESNGRPGDRALLEKARGLFEALGRAPIPRDRLL